MQREAGLKEYFLLQAMQWTCSVCLDECLDEYKDPRQLSCTHTFCTDCISGVMDAAGDRTKVKCPLCREYTKVCSLLSGSGFGHFHSPPDRSNFFHDNAFL